MKVDLSAFAVKQYLLGKGYQEVILNAKENDSFNSIKIKLAEKLERMLVENKSFFIFLVTSNISI